MKIFRRGVLREGFRVHCLDDGVVGEHFVYVEGGARVVRSEHETQRFRQPIYKNAVRTRKAERMRAVGAGIVGVWWKGGGMRQDKKNGEGTYSRRRETER
jgi:hypothetical protein